MTERQNVERQDETPLTWSVCVPTRSRRSTLQVCLRQAALEDPAPKQVIVVDSSPPDEQSDAVVAELALQFPDIEWTHEIATVGSLTRQRQRSIELASSDIVFTLDDDTILYPGAAKAVLEVYEADELGQIAGIEMTEWCGPPGGVDVDDSADPFDESKLSSPAPSGRLRSAKNRAVARLLMFNPTLTFVPYDRDYPTHPVPTAVAAMDVYPVDLMLGYRMTYRRSMIADLELTPEFMAYTPVEDFDLSYRASRRGGLLCSQQAGVYHHRARSGRLSRSEVESKSLLNLALLLRRHATDQRWARRRYVGTALHRAFADLVRDAGTRRWNAPTCRGCLSGTLDGLRVLRASDEAYADTYSTLQQRFL